MLQPGCYQKALAHLLTLFDDDIDKHLLARGNRLVFQQDTVCLLYSGEYSLLRRHDELLVTRGSAPAIVGLILPDRGQQFVTVRANDNCWYRLVSNEDFFMKIDEHRAYRQVYTLLLEHITWQYQREALLLGHNSLTCVQGAIRLFDRLDQGVRAGTNIADFVVKSTNLSRSIVMKSIAFLRQNNAIETEKGKLIRINYLPDLD